MTIKNLTPWIPNRKLYLDIDMLDAKLYFSYKKGSEVTTAFIVKNNLTESVSLIHEGSPKSDESATIANNAIDRMINTVFDEDAKD